MTIGQAVLENVLEKQATKDGCTPGHVYTISSPGEPPAQVS